MNSSILVITGLPSDVPRRLVMEWLEDVAQLVEERIANDFDRERAGGAALKRNKTSYTERKAMEGLDERRGHATGNLQNELDAGGFARFNIMSGGRATIAWSDKALFARVDYAEYYAEAKVKGGRILKVLPVDVRAATAYLRDVGQDWLKGAA
jgi:hypothetical protein